MEKLKSLVPVNLKQMISESTPENLSNSTSLLLDFFLQLPQFHRVIATFSSSWNCFDSSSILNNKPYLVFVGRSRSDGSRDGTLFQEHGFCFGFEAERKRILLQRWIRWGLEILLAGRREGEFENLEEISWFWSCLNLLLGFWSLRGVCCVGWYVMSVL